MLIGLPHQISKISNPSLFLPSNHPITHTDSAHNLGFIFDSSLTFSKQISSLCSACNYNICDHRRIRHTLDLKTASIIATSLVHSKLDYCNSPPKLTAKTNTSSPATAKLPCSHSNSNPKTEHITPVLQYLHWLKMEECIHYKIISLTYDFHHTSQRQYLRNRINIKPAGSTRSFNHLTLLHPSTTSSLIISNR